MSEFFHLSHQCQLVLPVLVISAGAGVQRLQTAGSSSIFQWWIDSLVVDSHTVERKMCRQSTTLQ